VKGLFCSKCFSRLKIGRFAVELEILAWTPVLKSRANEQTRGGLYMYSGTALTAWGGNTEIVQPRVRDPIASISARGFS
jgi:hypothetical protein